MIPPSGREHEQYIPGEQVLTVANLYRLPAIISSACIFFTLLSETISLFQGVFFKKFFPYVWLVFKSGLLLKAGLKSFMSFKGPLFHQTLTGQEFFLLFLKANRL